MSRTGKIDASGPVKSSTYLKKHIMTLHPDARIGRSVEYDVVEYSVAKKACNKSFTEGQVSGIMKAKSIVHNMSNSQNHSFQDLMILLNKAIDETLSQSI